MSALDELIERGDGPGWQECGVAYALRTVDPGDAEKFRKAMANPHVGHSEIAREFAARMDAFAPIGMQVSRHRRGECKCRKG